MEDTGQVMTGVFQCVEYAREPPGIGHCRNGCGTLEIHGDESGDQTTRVQIDASGDMQTLLGLLVEVCKALLQQEAANQELARCRNFMSRHKGL